MSILTRNEEIFLIAIWKLKNNAYGVTIREDVIKMTGREIVYGTLYNSLDKLVKKGYVSTLKSDPTPERGGRSKVFYKLTQFGFSAPKNTHELNRSIWEGIPVSDLGNKFGEQYDKS